MFLVLPELCRDDLFSIVPFLENILASKGHLATTHSPDSTFDCVSELVILCVAFMQVTAFAFHSHMSRTISGGSTLT